MLRTCKNNQFDYRPSSFCWLFFSFCYFDKSKLKVSQSQSQLWLGSWDLAQGTHLPHKRPSLGQTSDQTLEQPWTIGTHSSLQTNKLRLSRILRSGFLQTNKDLAIIQCSVNQYFQHSLHFWQAMKSLWDPELNHFKTKEDNWVERNSWGAGSNINLII